MMMKYFRVVVASAAFFYVGIASAQNAGTVTNHAIPIGKGAGVAGYGSLALTSGQIVIGQTGADPIAVAPTGDVTINPSGVTAVGANKITNAMLRQSGALALVGRSANSTGNVADIQASPGSSCVFLESASSLTCANIATANIANNAVTNAKAAQMAAYTFKCNNSGSTANAGDCDATAFTTKGSPVSADIVVIQDSAAGNAYKKTTVGALATAGSVSSLNGQTGAIVSYFPPQGRLTLTSGTAVMASSVAAATTVYYTPFAGNMVPIYDGTNIVPTSFAEVSQATTDTTKSPAAVGASQVFDIFCWVDTGPTNRCTRGPAWTNDTTRCAGCGLTYVNGLAFNTTTITNGPAAQRGTWVGTVGSNASSTVDYIFGAAGTGGVAAVFNVWNAYNRVQANTTVSDTTSTWTYGVASTWRPANNSATARITTLRGADVDGSQFTYAGLGTTGTSAGMNAGVCLNGAAAYSGTTENNVIAGGSYPIRGNFSGLMGLGRKYAQPCEWNSNTNASTWVGLSSQVQTGFHGTVWQ